jgi:5'-phosphate synthase pdxT subunit
MQRKRIGVLALQGDFEEHCEVFRFLGQDAMEIRRASELDKIDGLVIPGGESTTVAKLENVLTQIGAEKHGIFETITEKVKNGMPVWGTCMGSIVLAKKIEGSGQGRIGLMDITVRRNAFGPQKFSSEIALKIPALGSKPFPGIFIRAPLFIKAAKNVDVLSSIAGGHVMLREKNMLATAFHPEITSDRRVHEYFLEMVAASEYSLNKTGSRYTKVSLAA